MLPARHRLRTSADFRAAVRGPRVRGALLVVHTDRAGTRRDLPPRVGFVVSKAVGNAVTRNRVKRRLRAAMAGRIAGLPAGTDVVVRATPAAATAGYAELDAALGDLVARVLQRRRGRREAT